MKIHRYLTAFLLVAVLCPLASAEPSCRPTVRIAANNYPGADVIPTTNNLVLPTGKSIEAQGQKLVIQGRLVDSQCMPVKEAVVELWQVDPFGKYTLAFPEDIVTPRPMFAGAGRVITDSEGNFSFITGFPGVIVYQVWESYQVKIKGETVTKKRQITIHRTPHINLRVKADGFQPFSTVLFFDGDRRNAADVVYKKLSAADQASVTLTMSQSDDEQVIGSKEIVLAGRSRYRTY